MLNNESTDHLAATRRAFLQQNSLGIGGIALAWLLKQSPAIAKKKLLPKNRQSFDLTAKKPPKPAKAKAMISLFQHGGPSHMDLTDPKPELSKYDGTEYKGEVGYSFVNEASKTLMGSPWKFQKHGQAGTEISELLPHTSGIVDDLCLIRSMHTGANGHEVSIRYFHGGIPGVLGRPHLASWLLYGLGCETENLPAYMVLTDPGGPPVDSTNNWSSGFMPALFQGTVLRPREPRILNLNAPAHLEGISQRQNLDFLESINQKHAEKFPNANELQARIASYELAAKMQVAATDALDISQEPKYIHQMYGLEQDETREYGTRCLIARRLVERGVRFVQLFLNGQPWDNHSNLGTNLPSVCKKTDQPSAALVKDLKQRGMLDEVLVHWGGEIGRLPVTQNQGAPEKHGRDHNGQGFSIWLAGGGIKPGMTFGATDEFGHKAVRDRVSVHDFHATVLHLLGLHHQKLFFTRRGLEERLTGFTPPRVVKDILA